jgi:hypothetical protein
MVAATLWVSVAVLLVAIGALVVGIIGMRDTHMIRDELTIDLQRRTEEMRPGLSGIIYDYDDDGSSKLLLILWITTAWPISKLEIFLRPAMGYAFTTHDEGRATLRGTVMNPESGAAHALTPGGSVAVPVVRTGDQWRNPTVTAYANCYGRFDEEWREVPITITMPSSNFNVIMSPTPEIPWPTNMAAIHDQDGDQKTVT